ncbi:MAG: peptidoglycan DD-metalloendopeptidase family protein [Gemmatimonadales bacterium]
MSFDLPGRIKKHILGSGIEGHEFGYDHLSRLKSVADIHFEGPNPCDGGKVDENGNTCTYEGTWETDSVTSFAYDSAGNRRDLSGDYSTGNRITAFDGCTYQTDLEGNVVRRACVGDTVTFAWTAEGWLSSQTRNGVTTTFDYDAVGRLVRKSTGGTMRHFLWEGDNLLAELDGAGTAKLAEYSYYPGLDNPHALIVRDTTYFAHRDGLGNVIALTDQAQAVKRTYEYDVWGKSVGGADGAGLASADRARFKGALWMGPELDIYYMRARWYEPKTGRFLSEDPIGLAGGINAYVFAGDDPINHRDPSGLGECYYLVRWTYVRETGVIVNAEIIGYYCLDGGSDTRGGSSEARPQQQQQQCPAGAQRPVPGLVTSPFGDTSRPPGSSNPHVGTDIAASFGLVVWPMAPGVVIDSRFSSSAGNMVVVEHARGFTTFYYHLNQRFAFVGDSVWGMTNLGTVGMTGSATTPHLHLELRHNNQRIDPEACFP